MDKTLLHTAFVLQAHIPSYGFIQQLLHNQLPGIITIDATKTAVCSQYEIDQLIAEEAKHGFSFITPYAGRPLQTMSGGERKRTLLYYWLSQSCNCLILDNIWEHIDIATQKNIQTRLLQAGITTTIIQIVRRSSDILPFIHRRLYLDDAQKWQTQPANHSPTSNVEVPQLPPPAQPMQEENNPLVAFNQVTVHYGETTIVQNITWQINKGESWQLKGPNGSGKTTLLTMITGDNPKAYGQNLVLFGKPKGTGESVWDIKQKIGYMTPAMTDLFQSRHTVTQIIAGGYYDSLGLYVRLTEQIIQLTKQWLKLAGMEKQANMPFITLSNGYQRLVLIIRAMVKHPPLLILDEPTTDLDDAQTAIVMAFIQLIALHRKTAIVYVSHREEKYWQPEKIFELVPTSQGSIGQVVR